MEWFMRKQVDRSQEPESNEPILRRDDTVEVSSLTITISSTRNKYVYFNPVDAGLCDEVSTYPYSTIHGLLGRQN